MIRFPSAEEVAVDLLYKTGRALEAANYEAFKKCFAIPCVVETAQSLKVIESYSGLQATFDSVVSYYAEQRVVSLARDVIEAKFLANDTIGSTHVTRLLRLNGDTFRNPFPTYSILRRTPKGEWKINSCTYAILDCEDHNSALATVRS